MFFWISLKPRDKASLFKEEHQIHVSNNAVKRFLKDFGYGYIKPSKVLATGSYSNRNEQFKITFDMVLILSIKSPVISIDCIKRVFWYIIPNTLIKYPNLLVYFCENLFKK